MNNFVKEAAAELVKGAIKYLVGRFAGREIPPAAQDAAGTLVGEFLDGDFYLNAGARFDFQEQLEARLQKEGL